MASSTDHSVGSNPVESEEGFSESELDQTDSELLRGYQNNRRRSYISKCVSSILKSWWKTVVVFLFPLLLLPLPLVLLNPVSEVGQTRDCLLVERG